MKYLRVKVAPGRKIRDPRTSQRLRPDATTGVPANSYWFRRIKDGDVLLQKEPKKSPPKTASKKTGE